MAVGSGDQHEVTVPAQERPDGLTATWSGEIEGSAATVTTYAEVVGGQIVGLNSLKSELEAVHADPMPDDDRITEKRHLAQQRIEAACRVAFRPRYARARIEAERRDRLLLPRPRLISVLSINGFPFNAPASTAGEIVNPGGTWWDGTYDVAWIHGWTQPPPAIVHAVSLLALHYLLVDPDDLDARATFKSNDEASWSLVTPGVRGARFPIPEVNEIVKELGYPGEIG